MTTPRSIIIALTAALALAGCTVGPNYTPPKTATPPSWTEFADSAAADGPWWRSFHDPVLDSLVDRAARSNTDIRIGLARIREARARRGIVSAALYPRVDASGSFSNSRFSENGFLQGLGAPSGGGLPGAIAPGQQINLYQVGLDASWEIDLFGGQRREVEAADADLAAAGLDAGDVIRTVQAEVADGYIQLRGLQTRLDLAQRVADIQQRTLAVIREQTSAGIASDLDLSRAESQAATSLAALPDLEGATRVAIRRIELLLGAVPGTLDTELSPAAPIPSPPDALAAGIPSETLRRRPDVRAAERRLAASTARIGVATAAYFPRFSLTGSFGLQSQKIEDLPTGDSRFWAIGPTIRWPILNFGAIRSAVAAQNARTQAAEAAYEGSVLSALNDVEVALVQVSRERRRGADLRRAAEAADRSANIAEDLYRNGLIEYTDLLDAQRTQASAWDAEARSRSAVGSGAVALYKALGGGWADTAPDRAAPPVLPAAHASAGTPSQPKDQPAAGG